MWTAVTAQKPCKEMLIKNELKLAFSVCSNKVSNEDIFQIAWFSNFLPIKTSFYIFQFTDCKKHRIISLCTETSCWLVTHEQATSSAPNQNLTTHNTTNAIHSGTHNPVAGIRVIKTTWVKQKPMSKKKWKIQAYIKFFKRVCVRKWTWEVRNQ